MSTAKDGVELQPHGSKHMTLGYYGVSAWLTQGKTAVEVKQGSLNLASAAYLPRKDRLRGEKEKKKMRTNKKTIYHDPECNFKLTGAEFSRLLLLLGKLFTGLWG